MGNSELVESDHTDVIEAACIEGMRSIKLNSIQCNQPGLSADKVSLHQFDDRKTTGDHITTTSWFSRMSVTFSGRRPKIKVGKIIY